MAEFCLECWKKMNRYEDDDSRCFVLSKEPDLCEGCGEWKSVVIMEGESYYMRIVHYLFFPLQLIFLLIVAPYYLIKQIINKSK